MKVTKRTKRCRKQEETYCQRNTAEQERYDRGHCSTKITENNTTNSNRQNEWMLEQILSDDNLKLAYKKVKKNKGAGGIDKMTTDELLGYLIDHQRELHTIHPEGNIQTPTLKAGRNTKRQRENKKTWYTNSSRQNDSTSHCTRHYDKKCFCMYTK
jgi:hypothetical protein